MVAIIVDIDGTIADCRHRRHFVTNGNHDWKSFYEYMSHDKPIQPIINIVNDLLYAANNIILCTGRPEEYRPHTEKWLDDHNVKYSSLIMRDNLDYRPDYVMKEDVLLQLHKANIYPFLAIDDKQEVVNMWRANGIVCLQNSMKEMQ